jgi:hypothetical protein
VEGTEDNEVGLSIDNTIFDNIVSIVADGGSIYAAYASVNITDQCKFSTHRVEAGSGGCIFFDAYTKFNLNGCIFKSYNARTYIDPNAGPLYISQRVPERYIPSDNEKKGRGGAILLGGKVPDNFRSERKIYGFIFNSTWYGTAYGKDIFDDSEYEGKGAGFSNLTLVGNEADFNSANPSTNPWGNTGYGTHVIQTVVSYNSPPYYIYDCLFLRSKGSRSAPLNLPLFSFFIMNAKFLV